MVYFIAAVVAVVAAALAYVTLDKALADKIRLFNIASGKEQDRYTSLSLKRWQLVLITVAVGVMSFAVMLQLQHEVEAALNICKMTIALLCMVGAGCFDLREQRIPNFFPAILALSAMALLMLGFVLKLPEASDCMTSSAMAATGCAIFLILASVLTKQGIGAGDIKLITALALMTGVYPVIGTLFFGAIICCVASIVMLILKWKDKSGAVPFGPFLLLGYVITVLLDIY